MAAGRPTSPGLETFILVSVLAASAPRVASVQAIVANGTSADVPRELVLRPALVPYDLENANWNLTLAKVPFRKEPELSQGHVFRSRLQFDEDTNNAIALIWDQPKHKLYLDLNRNLDLTDDPTGVFSSTNKGFQQLFSNVTLPLKTPTGLHRAPLDLYLSSDPQGNWARVGLHSRSLWQAKVTLQGEDWQVAAVDDLLGSPGPALAKFLLLRPWATRTNRVSLYYPPSGIVPFPNGLFWLGQAFQVEPCFDSGGDTAVCKLRLTPQQPPLTDLKLSGESLDYALLCATNGYAVLLHDPPGIVKVPQGVYTISSVWLKKGPIEAFRLPGGPHVVNALTNTRLVLGGPLTNCVALERSGRKLLMNYRLQGADGQFYRLAQQDRPTPPEFTVYHGGRKVLTGQFQFG
jgi:hypothetical protein